MLYYRQRQQRTLQPGTPTTLLMGSLVRWTQLVGQNLGGIKRESPSYCRLYQYLFLLGRNNEEQSSAINNVQIHDWLSRKGLNGGDLTNGSSVL